MSIRIVCSNGEARVPRSFLKNMSLFESNPELAACDSYTLSCKAGSDSLNFFLEKVYDETTCVDPHEITEDNFAELKALSTELGFPKFDKALRVFEAGRLILFGERLDEYEEKLENIGDELWEVSVTLKDKIYNQESSYAELQMQMRRHEQLFQDLQRRLDKLESGKMKSETEWRDSVSCQIQSLERKFEEVGLLCEERSYESLRKVVQAIKECPKQSDLVLAVEQLKQSEKEIPDHPQQKITSGPAAHTSMAKRGLKDDANKESSVLSVSDRVKKEGSGREFVYDESKKLDGVIAHLARECRGNVHDKGIVNVTASSVCAISSQPKNAVDLRTDSRFWSRNEANAWICYDFRERRVIPTSYSVRSWHDGPGSCHLKSWVIEVSNDGHSWTEIDRRDDNNDLNSSWVTVNFKISRVPSESFRFFRLRQAGKNHQGDYCLDLSALEIFGTLFVREKVEKQPPPKQDFVYHADGEGHFPPPLFPPKLDGVIAYLTRECGGNVHERRVVNVTVSSNGDNARNAVDLGTERYYGSRDERNSWICYDFKERRVVPTSYSVRSCKWGPGGAHLKSWVIEVSNDRSSWTEIDRRDNNDLNGYFLTENFEISRVPSEGIRFFRLKQTGENHRGDNQLSVNSLEIFGTLFEK